MLAGVTCVDLNRGSVFKYNEAFSFQIATDDQGGTDCYLNSNVGNGGRPGERVRLLQGQVGSVLANHAAHPDGGACGQRSSQAHVRYNNGQGPDRRRCV